MTEHFEKQVSNFEQKVKEDSLNAFNEMLTSYKKQSANAQKIVDDVKKYKALLSEWAEKAHYRINWDKFTATPFQQVGDCMRCSKKNIGILKYSDFKGGYMVCDSCYDRLCDEFDDEMK